MGCDLYCQINFEKTGEDPVVNSQIADEIADLQRQLAAKQEELDDWVHTNKIGELQRQLAEREDELTHRVHPFYLEKYRKSK